MSYDPRHDVSTMVAKRHGEVLTNVEINGTRRGGGLLAHLTWERQVFDTEATPALDNSDLFAVTTTTVARKEDRYFSEAEIKAFLTHHGFKV
jgi:hypothetical protein